MPHRKFWTTGPESKKPDFLGVFNFVSSGDEVKQWRMQRLPTAKNSVPLAHNYCVSAGDALSLQLHISHRRAMLQENYSPLGNNFHFGPTGSEVGATVEILSRWDIISGPVARSSKWCPAGTPFPAHLILALKCQHHRNLCATGTQVKNAAPVGPNK